MTRPKSGLDDAREVKYDSCEWSYAYNRYEFYYDEELVAWTRSDFYRFYGSPEEEPYGPEYRLVSVRFDANGRIYDYICEDTEVKAGDRVVVNGYDGEIEVTVSDVRVKRESELPLPVERYKKIVRKVEALDDIEGIPMKNGISLEEAIKKAKNRKPKYNRCVEHPNAWSFSYDDGTDEISIGGPDTGIVIMKEDGRMLMPYEYYMNDEIGSAEVIDEFDI